ncbi:hypothetical protein GQ53DRAFT_796183 [Thozetella sp. PMI_491]|nr:hypothetical protein GQ53DRAFT_796183 [Thozetella sp. PMI_491]
MQARRKVRKGTQSCWECKRRKIKCIFATPADAICGGCKRRGTSCIGQEFSESPDSNRQQLGDRLGRVEELLGKLIDTPENLEYITNVTRATPQSIPLAQGSSTYPTYQGPSVNPDIFLPVSLGGDELSRALLAAWPSEHDLAAILGSHISSLGHFHGLICMPYEQFMRQGLPSPSELLLPPSPGWHPVLIAQKLLTLGTILQGLSPPTIEELENRGTRVREIRSRAVETASRLVSSNDELVGSIEGIECIMAESMYRNNSGNLRRAYLAMRRALVIGQMVGLGRGANSPLLKFIEPATRTRVSPNHMWFRILQSDGYLSMMLGLPQGSLDRSFAASALLGTCTPMERMERIECLAGRRISERNYTDVDDLNIAEEIDAMLRDAASSMPPQWWLPPNFSTASDGTQGVHDMVRMMNQFTHYHLLQQLHLPYLLRPSSDRALDRNKIAAVTASRELLSRFVSFRRSQDTGVFCRGVDFLALIASTALSLAHIDAHRSRYQIKSSSGSITESAVFHVLIHQRLSDRGMMESVLEGMEKIAAISSDGIAGKIASILRHLLDVEAEAAIGGSYAANLCHGDEKGDLECNGKVTDEGRVLHVCLPHIGTIKIERHDVYRSPFLTQTSTTEDESARYRQEMEPTHVSLPNSPTLEIHNPSQASDAPSFAGFYDNISQQEGQWLVPGLEPEEDWML